MQAIEYWRHNKTWAKDLGKKGKVLAATEVFVGAEEQEKQLPYFYVLVELCCFFFRFLAGFQYFFVCLL